MENSFEKSIRDTMENPPDFPFDEGMWKKMEAELDRNDTTNRKRGAIAWWWLVPAMLLPSILASWLFIGRQQDQQRISELEVSHSNTRLTDTIIEKRVTVIYDTIIHKTTILAQAQEVARPAYAPIEGQFGFSRHSFSASDGVGNIMFPNFFSSPAFPFLKKNSFGVPSTTPTSSSDNDADQAESSSAISDANSRVAYLTTQLQYLVTERSLELPPVSPNELRKRRRSAGYYTAKIIPRSLAVSAGAGVFSALHLPDTDGASELKVGQIELGYGRHFYFTLGVERLNLRFLLEHEGAESFNYFPAAVPNNPDDELEGLSGMFDYWQFPLGLKYRFSVERRLQPYVGLGVIGVMPSSATLSYEFEDDNDQKYNINQLDLLTSTLNFSDAFGLVGAQWRLFPKLQLLIEVSGQNRWQKGGNDFERNRFAKGKLGLRYRF